MVTVHTYGLMAVSTKENGRIINCMVMVYILGQMVENMKGGGKIPICMDLVNIHGKMEDTMKGIIIMIKNTDKELIDGLMVKFILEVGSKGSNTVKVNIHTLQVK